MKQKIPVENLCFTLGNIMIKNTYLEFWILNVG